MPTLDITTLTLISAVVDLSLALIMLHARLTRTTYPGFDCWLAGTVCWSVGAACNISFANVLPHFVAKIFGVGLIMLSGLFLYEGFMRFYSIPRRWWRTPLNGLIVTAGFLVQCYFFYVVDDMPIRVINISMVCGVIYLRSTLEPLLSAQARSQFIQWLLFIFTIPLAAMEFLRAAHYAFIAHDVNFSYMVLQDSLLRGLIFYAIIIELILVYTYLSLTSDRTEHELRASEQRFRNLAESSADVIWQLDNNLRYCYINEADAQMRGFTPDEVLGRHITDFLVPEAAEQLLAANRERLSQEQQGVRTGPLCYEIQQLCKHKRCIWTEVHTAPLRDEQGKISGYIGISRDISVRKANELKQAELLAQEQRAREEQERFLSMLSHEYRTPLAILQSNIEVLGMKQGMMGENLEPNLLKMQRAVNRLVEVLERGRKRDCPAPGMKELVLEPLSVALFITEIRDEAIDYWGASRFSFQNPVADTIVIRADSRMMRTVLLNLLDNAVKYSEPGDIVECKSSYGSQVFEFSVQNRSQRPLGSGNGAMFQKYTRGSNSANIPGTGVGLWLAKQIVDLHGGGINFEVSESMDVTVTVRMPAEQINEVNHADESPTNFIG